MANERWRQQHLRLCVELLPAELASVPVSLIDGAVLVFPAGVAQLFPHSSLEKSLQVRNIYNQI